MLAMAALMFVRFELDICCTMQWRHEYFIVHVMPVFNFKLMQLRERGRNFERIVLLLGHYFKFLIRCTVLLWHVERASMVKVMTLATKRLEEVLQT